MQCALVVYNLRVSGHFERKNYVWKLVTIQKSWWTLLIFLVWLFLTQSFPIIPNHILLHMLTSIILFEKLVAIHNSWLVIKASNIIEWSKLRANPRYSNFFHNISILTQYHLYFSKKSKAFTQSHVSFA